VVIQSETIDLPDWYSDLRLPELRLPELRLPGDGAGQESEDLEWRI
jgi:hypothetical protein